MSIPIRNIYYLLCYAWDCLEHGAALAVDLEDKATVMELFAGVLLNAGEELVKRDLAAGYLPITEEVAGIRGKLELASSIKSGVLRQQRTICTYDEFTRNVPLNRVIVSTIERMCSVINIDNSLKYSLHKLKARFVDIKSIALSRQLFRAVGAERLTAIQRFVLRLCEFIFESCIPSKAPEKYIFQDFIRDERRMAKVFETFLRNFYRREQSMYDLVKPNSFQWRLKPTSEEAKTALPSMNTDITLENHDKRIIIEAKYYKETMSTRFTVEKIRSAHLYQLFSYLMNQRDGTPKTLSTIGILLYPTVTRTLDLEYVFQQHIVAIRTVNLNAPWSEVVARLHNIVTDCWQENSANPVYQ